MEGNFMIHQVSETNKNALHRKVDIMMVSLPLGQT